MPIPILHDMQLLGADIPTIQQGTQAIINADPNAAAGTFPAKLTDPNLLAAINTLAAVLSTVSVQIEIKPPATPPVPINPGSSGNTPVAILSTSSFNATTVLPGSVRLDGGTAKDCSAQDANGDGVNDLLCHITTSTMTIPSGSSQATLTGKTASGQSIKSTEEIVSVP